MSESDFTNPDRRRPVEEALRQLQQLLDQCAGVELDECLAESTGRMTIDVFLDFAIWDYDDLSLNADMTPPLAVP
jgi:hypothetical protein